MEKAFEVWHRSYTVDETGRIRNKWGRVLKPQTDKYGYRYLVFRGDGVRRKYMIHRLVAQAFIPNPNNLPQVNHINGIKHDNRVQNLEWVTDSENQTHSRYALGNVTGFPDTPVTCVETGATYLSTRDAWRATGINYCHISECTRGKRGTAGGYHWKGAD